MELEDLKEEYEKLAKKYRLPKFDEMNLDFEIEKVDRETDYVLRAIRKLMMEKVVNSINFLEMLINPVNAPRLYMPYINSMSVEDRKLIGELYDKLTKLTLVSLKLELSSVEKEEAGLIKDTFNEWDYIKKRFSMILDNISKPNKNSVRKERTYFG